MVGNKRKSIWFKIIVITLFAFSLTGLRLMWNTYFQHEEDQPMAKSGVLDLTEWDFSTNGIVTLSGEWVFYPYTMYDDLVEAKEKSPKQFIDVPGDWSEQLNGDKDKPYGYGTYHLRIQTDPNLEEVFKVQVPSVRSASALYLNEKLIGSSGTVGTNEQNSIAHNIPYTSSTVEADEVGEINLYLEATNFIDPRSSGLIRAVKLGLKDEIVAETNLSSLLQMGAAVIFVVHALFAMIIYFIGIRDERLLYFSLIVVTMAIINVTYGDEKVLNQFVHINYKTSLKMASFLVLILFIWIIQAIRQQLNSISKYIVPTLTVLYIVLIIMLVLLPIEYLNTYIIVISYAFIITFVLSIAIYFRSSKEIANSLPFALAIVALMSHFFWFFYLMTAGIKVVHYPFDLIIAIVCVATVWFKQYYELHQESIALTEQLQLIDETKDKFLANTSHELRNPLHSILNISEAVLQRERRNLQTESITDLETVLSVSKQMSTMVNELLDIASIEAGKPRLQLQAVSMAAIVDGVIDMVTYDIDAKSVRIKNKIPDDFPFVYGDENRLIQVMFNLVHNAVKYTREGKITIAGEIQDDLVYISVMDTGIGMSEETVATIFDRYVQGTNAQDIAEGGFGIGLYISDQLIKLHGGSLQVQSTLEEGSTFTFSLPMASEDDQAVSEMQNEWSIEEFAASHVPSLPADELDKPSQPTMENDPRIIIVDDEPVNLRVIETILGKEQYTLASVQTAEEALKLIDQFEVDLIIADVMMPKMSGYELTRTIRQRFSLLELPILLVTARSSQEDIKVGFASGANDYIIKPIDAVELRSRVKALTSARQSMRERLQMEAAWLQAQIKPHFLFNTLNSIIALSQIDLERMTKMLNAFSDILRAKFNFENLDELVPLQNEISLIESYVEIEQVRFGERLQVTFDIDASANVMIPTLSIQPLIENAINHGVMSRDEGGEVSLRVQVIEDKVKVIVADDGLGMEEGLLEKLLGETFTEEAGVGLMNIHLRLKRLYGQGLHIDSSPNKGTKLSFTIPIQD